MERTQVEVFVHPKDVVKSTQAINGHRPDTRPNHRTGQEEELDDIQPSDFTEVVVFAHHRNPDRIFQNTHFPTEEFMDGLDDIPLPRDSRRVATIAFFDLRDYRELLASMTREGIRFIAHIGATEEHGHEIMYGGCPGDSWLLIPADREFNWICKVTGAWSKTAVKVEENDAHALTMAVAQEKVFYELLDYWTPTNCLGREVELIVFTRTRVKVNVSATNSAAAIQAACDHVHENITFAHNDGGVVTAFKSDDIRLVYPEDVPRSQRLSILEGLSATTYRGDTLTNVSGRWNLGSYRAVYLAVGTETVLAPEDKEK